MCCLYGIIDCRRALTAKRKNQILSAQAAAAEARGTDATGIAYNDRGKLRIYKRPWPAHFMRFRVPEDARVVMGHTRMTTQGNGRRNCNNHPFPGRTRAGAFALAHNGVLYNDKSLRTALDLPRTRIETDSFIAVQLIERKKALDFSSLTYMAEQVEGSFTFTVLDAQDNFYIVKGDSPLCLYHFSKLCLYLYASTEEILKKALTAARMSAKCAERVELTCGEILRIDAEGAITRSRFDASNLLYCRGLPLRPYSFGGQVSAPRSHLDEIKSVAAAFGYTPETIDRLADRGFSAEELEELLYCGEV